MLFRSSFESEAMPGKRQVVTCYLRALPAETLCWWKGCLLYTRHFFWLSKFELILYILLMRFCARCPPKFPQEKRRGSKSEVTSFSSFLKCSSCHKLRSVTLMGDRSFHPWVRLQQHFCGDLLNVSQFIYRIIRSSLFSVNLSKLFVSEALILVLMRFFEGDQLKIISNILLTVLLATKSQHPWVDAAAPTGATLA